MFGGAAKVFTVLAILTQLNNQVDSAAFPHHDDPQEVHEPQILQDADVRELESLKQPPNEGQAIQVVKSHSSLMVHDDITGKHTEHQNDRNIVNKNGELFAGVHQTSDLTKLPGEAPNQHSSIEIEIPSEGIHKTITHDSNDDKKQLSGAAPPQSQAESADIGSKRSSNADIAQEENNNMDHFSSYTGVQYSPLDMAEYIFWTGDEKGVTTAIEGFLKEGLMTREDAINFLQEIKFNIDYLQEHYSQLRNKGPLDEKQLPMLPYQGEKFNHENMLKAIIEGNFERNNNLVPPLTLPDMPFNIAPEYNKNLYKRNMENMYKTAGLNNLLDQYENEPVPTVSEEEYDEILEKLKISDFMHTESSLQDIVYQLSKIMLAQSLAHSTLETKQALQKFTNYLEIESDQGRLSKSLERKVLDILIEALTDTLSEHPELAYLAQSEYTNPLPAKYFTKYIENKQAPKITSAALMKDNLMKMENLPKRQPAWIMNQMKNLQMQPAKRFKVA